MKRRLWPAQRRAVLFFSVSQKLCALSCKSVLAWQTRRLLLRSPDTHWKLSLSTVHV